MEHLATKKPDIVLTLSFSVYAGAEQHTQYLQIITNNTVR